MKTTGTKLSRVNGNAALKGRMSREERMLHRQECMVAQLRNEMGRTEVKPGDLASLRAHQAAFDTWYQARVTHDKASARAGR